MLGEDLLKPTIVAMHHPPFVTGIRATDEIGIPIGDRAVLAEIASRHPQIARLEEAA